jgi:hypothetical protein
MFPSARSGIDRKFNSAIERPFDIALPELTRQLADELDLAAHFVLESIVALVHSAIQEPLAAQPQAIEAEIVALVMAYLSAPRRLRAELRRA